MITFGYNNKFSSILRSLAAIAISQPSFSLPESCLSHTASPTEKAEPSD